MIAHAEWSRSCNAQDEALRWTCTLDRDHDGEHVASDGLRVVATW